ncbi:hypothetical protein [Rhodoblastus sp.]|uniref:hypothetical protein n=1 Tax=Rhodoblastus sp. TaxID=1962975 RepID=UPI003F975053
MPRSWPALTAPAAWASESNFSGKAKHATHSHAAKAGKSARRHARDRGGVHPLVGSGDY